MIIHTSLLWFAGGLTVNQGLIILQPKFRGNKALIAHEQTHQKQMAKVGTFTFWWRYLTDKAFRQASEVEAYRASIENGEKRETCAWLLSNNYRLGIDYSDAYRMLTS